jgi:ABC-type dipeptide/oligopeptide/nickel transport system permease subunit/LysM repeat protein
MLRFVLRRLAIIPLGLLLVNFFGYAYAHLVLPLRASRIPYLASLPDPGPLLPSYLEYLGNALRFEFSPLPGTEETLIEVILSASLASAGLLIISLVLSVVLGLSLGVAAVKVEPRRIARWLTLLSSTGLAMPSFYIGSLLILVSFYYTLRTKGDMLLPLGGYGWDLHLVLPVLALLVRPTVQIAQSTAGLLETELGKRYIRTARSIGHLWQTIRTRHAMRNIMAPVVLLVAASARLLMGELILVEWLFRWPGLGNLFAQALVPAQITVRGQGGALLFLNPPVVATVLTAFAAFFLLIDLVAGVLVRVFDPRLRDAEEGAGSADVVSSQSGVRRRNWPLVLGSAIVLFVVVLALVGPLLAPQDPLEEHNIIQVEDGWEKAPFPLFTVPGFPLGSDERGRDLLSRLLWAVRPTIVMVLVVALVRLVLGTLIGMGAGWSNGWTGRILDGLIAGALSVPILMVALAAIAAMGLEVGVAAFLIGLSVTGWAETARLVREQTRLVRSQQYVEAARALGLADLRIVFQHVLRQIMPMVWMLLALEVAGTLMATAGLGFLGYYIGGDVWVEVADFVTQRLSGMPELGQMLATSNTGIVSLSVGALPWAMVAVGTMIFIIVLGFNLLGEGLRRRLSLEGARKQSLFSKLTDRVRLWYEASALSSSGAWAVRRAPRLIAVAAVLVLVIGAGTIWWRAQATKQTGESLAGLELPPGGHLWASEAYDPYGTRSITIEGPGDPQILWTFEDSSGFSGGPAVAADGTIYVASRDGNLYALDPAGELVWTVELAAGGVGTPALNAAGDVHVADKKGGLSLYAPDGTQRWRFQSEAGDLATTGPVVTQDGTIYYGLGSIVQAVSAEGAGLWSTRTPAFHRTLAPWLSPAGDMLFWQDVVLSTEDGALVDLGFPEEVNEYLTGSDAQTHFRVGHNVMNWELTAEGAEILTTTRWDPRALGTFNTPAHAGVTRDQIVWLFYTNPYAASRIAWLDPEGRVLGAHRIAYGRGYLVAIGPEGKIYVCGSSDPRNAPNPECIALVPDSDEPLWQVPLEAGERVMGGALVPGRLYVAANLLTMKEGTLIALGDEGGQVAVGSTVEPRGTEISSVVSTPTAAMPTATAIITGAPDVAVTAVVSEPLATEPVTASVPGPGSTPAAAGGSELWHTVKQGETLSSIARRYGTRWQAIARANDLVDPNQIYAGQKLRVPVAGDSAPGTASGCRIRHTVKRGEWLWQIARDFGASPQDVMAANGLTRQTANTIYAGMVLCIP